MSNIQEMKDLLDVSKNIKGKDTRIFVTLILCMLLTGAFGFIKRGFMIVSCIFMIILILYLFFGKEKSNESIESTDEQLKKMEAYTNLHREVGDTKTASRIYHSFFPDTGEGLTNGRIQTKSNETETDKSL